jgi:hypothetical protein
MAAERVDPPECHAKMPINQGYNRATPYRSNRPRASRPAPNIGAEACRDGATASAPRLEGAREPETDTVIASKEAIIVGESADDAALASAQRE